MSVTTRRPPHTTRPDPEPPHDGEDRSPWRTVYRGRGKNRSVGAPGEIALTPEQKAWLDSLAAEHRLTLVQAVSRALDLARKRDEQGEGPTPAATR